jgi:opacity protein-like surface antigen
MKNQNKSIVMCFFVVVLLFFSAAKADAQKADQSSITKVGVGARFQSIFAVFRMQNSRGEKTGGQAVVGYGGGTFMNYNFTKNIGIQVEMNYSSFSRKYSESDITRTVNLRYIEIPLLVSFNSNKNKIVNLNFVVGPQIGINAGSRIYTTGGEGAVIPNPILNVRDGNLGLAYGFGVDFGLNHKRTLRLGFGGRGVVGLVNISNNGAALNPGTYYILGKTQLHTYSAYIGFSFLL